MDKVERHNNSNAEPMRPHVFCLDRGLVITVRGSRIGGSEPGKPYALWAGISTSVLDSRVAPCALSHVCAPGNVTAEQTVNIAHDVLRLHNSLFSLPGLLLVCQDIMCYVVYVNTTHVGVLDLRRGTRTYIQPSTSIQTRGS